MIWHHVDNTDIWPKWVLNGFPKAGLHVVELMVSALAMAMPDNVLSERGWVGSFMHNAWSNTWDNSERVLGGVSRLQPGHYAKGHIGWRQEIEDYLYYSGAAVIFIYRDLRDVVVSQAHHVIDNDNVRFKHPAKEAYRALGEFENIISACIEGLGAFAGVIERWELYAPWLDVPWVYKVRFEDLIAGPEVCASEMVGYGIKRSTGVLSGVWSIDETKQAQVATKMAERSMQRHASPTFRRGEAGTWREVWTDEHARLFREHGGDEWLVRLGYEEAESSAPQQGD